ncbi:hypothetical protein GH714_016206 [Hevea brasiliensis]|uniref:C-JID domain-containing protein n=1 Tax=Hevea brasiliensis TaxID=3981 RepID=A0A6A6KS64_HEVBR|nr:hypothetical protein GH714_016025 [Hevea brasiliensis]KAF2290883.1 hypothetical protein GH714_016206 [Hevea brasiliensis]
MIPGDFYRLSSLVVLNISRNYFVNTPASISQLPQLRYLCLDDCRDLKALQKLPATMHEISANNCFSLETLSSQDAITGKWMWPIFYFTACFKLAVNQGCRFDVIVPGIHVPNLFIQQNMGSSIIIQLPPNWYNEKLKGLAGCRVFAIRENPHLLTDDPASDIAICCRLEAFDYTVTSSFQFLIYRIPSLQSDHLWIGFHS